MKLYNSLTRNDENIVKKNINIYSCGPTVYNFIHIGNARAIITVDLLVRTLENNNFNVYHVQNYTDIDDKIINKAQEENISEIEISEKYIKHFLEDVAALQVRLPDKQVKVTENINEMVEFINQLVEKGSAYVVEGNVYFDIAKHSLDYGKLSNQKILDIINVSRIEEDDKKKNVIDFTLWKKTEVGVTFDSPWGKGRPGWHTECVMFIDKYFNNKTIDIHTGGIDLIFPHHENERIQFIAKHNRELARIWLHNGHLNVDNQKMSKSLGNVVLLRDFLNKYGPNVLKYIFYTTSYTLPINLTDDLIVFAQKEISKIYELLKKINLHYQLNNLTINYEATGEFYQKVNQELLNDLSTTNAIFHLNELIKLINSNWKNNIYDYQLTNDFYLIVYKLLNLQFELVSLTSEDVNMYNEWLEAVNNKNYDKADSIRKLLYEKNIL